MHLFWLTSFFHRDYQESNENDKMKVKNRSSAAHSLMKAMKMTVGWKMANILVKFEQSCLKNKLLPVLVHCMRAMPIQMRLENCRKAPVLVWGLSIHSPVPVPPLVQSNRWLLEQCTRICTPVQQGRCKLVLLELQLAQNKIARVAQAPNSLDLGRRTLPVAVALVLVHRKPVLVLHTEKLLQVLECLAWLLRTKNLQKLEPCSSAELDHHKTGWDCSTTLAERGIRIGVRCRTAAQCIFRKAAGKARWA